MVVRYLSPAQAEAVIRTKLCPESTRLTLEQVAVVVWWKHGVYIDRSSLRKIEQRALKKIRCALVGSET